jgi:hypothetical protein
MKPVLLFFYLLVLALWTGGVALFTFIITPLIFKSYGRDEAGEIVGRLFPGYFVYLLVLSGLALLLFFLLRPDRMTGAYRVSLVLLTAALLVNIYVTFKLHPEAVKIKHRISSFERESPDSPARKEFRRLHAVSSVLNLFVMIDGVVLLGLSRYLVKD